MPEVGDVLRHILVVLLFAKIAAELSERARVPAVLGEITAGVLVGPSVLGLVGHDETLVVLGELGVVLLLLEVGLGMDLTELAAVGRSALSVACVGVVLPFALGYAVAAAAGQQGHVPLFLGAALTATSVGITARVFGDLRALASAEARTVLGAAVADDVLGLVMLTVVIRVVAEGSVSPATVVGVLALAVGFLAATTWAGVRFGPRLFDVVQRHARSSGTLVALALAAALAVAQLATLARLAPVVGAFVAGVALARSDSAPQIRRELTPVGHLLIPVFFLQIGIDVEVGRLADPRVLLLGGALTVVAAISKVVAGYVAGHGSGDRLLIGLGMLPRGEVGLIFAGLGLREGVLGDDAYAALLLVVLATTFVTPYLLRARLGRLRAAATRVPSAEPMPAGGWLVRTDDAVELAATPPVTSLLPVALQAARAVATGRLPGPDLLDWLTSTSEVPLRWDRASTTDLVALLDEGSVRSWRLLEVTGVLDRALPELAQALRRRHSDPLNLDPAGALHWSLLDSVRRALERDPLVRAATRGLAHRERLLLAALVLDCTGAGTNPIVIARKLVLRLDLGAATEQEVAALVADAELLRNAARRGESLDEEHVLQLAVHLEQRDRAAALYALSVAQGDLEVWERQRLDTLYALLAGALAQPDVTDRTTRNLVERRRAEATRLVGDNRGVAERIATAPRAYLLAQESADLARHARFLGGLPGRDEVRVSVAPLGVPGQWRIEVAARDRSGLLARVTRVLSEYRLDVHDAVVATWGDGAALESFRVLALHPPDVDDLQAAIRSALTAPLESPPVAEVELRWNDAASPWHCVVEVRAPDRTGVLHAVCTALARAGADVHSARIGTTDGVAVDRFAVTDRTGRKLDDATKEQVALLLRTGVRPRRRWVPRRTHQVGTSPKHEGHGLETRAS